MANWKDHAVEDLRDYACIRMSLVSIPEELARLRARVNTKSERADLNETRGGYGLHNINERIKIYYGPDYGLTIDSEAGVGTMVSLVIPKRSGTQAQPNNQLKKESGNV